MNGKQCWNTTTTKTMIVTLVIVTISVLVLVKPAHAASRQPNTRDHLHCKMQFSTEWEDVMQTADPYAVVEAYYDIHGTPCKTPCRLRSSNNPALNVVLGEKSSPNYENCGQNNKFCFEGECVYKRFQV